MKEIKLVCFGVVMAVGVAYGVFYGCLIIKSIIDYIQMKRGKWRQGC